MTEVFTVPDYDPGRGGSLPGQKTATRDRRVWVRR